MKIRVTAVILSVLMVILVLAGCSNDVDNSNNVTTTAQAISNDMTQSADTAYVPDFPEANYNNSDFVVYQRSANASSYPGFYITSSEVTDSMSESTFNRNVMVEDKYGVKISSIEEDSPYKSVEKLITSGDVPFDVILDRRYYMGSLAQDGYLYNFNDLDYVDFNQPWWDKNCADGYEIAGKLYFMANDISVSNLAGARFFYFNKAIVEQNGLESPYKLIDKNEWTLDNFLQMVQAVSSDLNGDGIYDGNDLYGLCSETGDGNGNIMHMLVGCGIRYTETDADGKLLTNAYSEKTQTIMSQIKDVLIGTNFVTNYDIVDDLGIGSFNNKFDFGRAMFADDHFLFIQGNMISTNLFKDMVSDYGVAPNPKYDSAQDSYHHKLDKYSLIWAIPQCDMDYDRLGMILEYWAYQSSLTVMPSFYEVTIKTKRVTEETASQIIDLVKATIMYDVSEIYDTGINTVIYNGYTSGNLSSSWASSKKVINKKLESIYNKISARS